MIWATIIRLDKAVANFTLSTNQLSDSIKIVITLAQDPAKFRKKVKNESCPVELFL